jgi:hypothetical protein
MHYPTANIPHIKIEIVGSVKHTNIKKRKGSELADNKDSMVK